MFFFKLVFPHWFLKCRCDIIIPTFYYEETRKQRGSKLSELQLELGLESQPVEEGWSLTCHKGPAAEKAQPSTQMPVSPGPGRASGVTCDI